jgi:tannase
LDKILNSTIAACDPLDGKTDGVVSRSDLCKLNFNLNSTIGMAYSCAATSSTSLGLGFGNKAKRQSTTTTPAQNGTVSAKGVAVAQTILNGLKDLQGRQAYLPY